MADFNLDRIRFRWRSDWVALTVYTKDDIVYYNGKAYVCLIGHTADASAYEQDLLHAQPKWTLMFDGREWKSDWLVSTYYTVGQIVKFKGYLYRCTAAHTSTNLTTLELPADITYWSIVATTYNWLNEWTYLYYYNLGDVVRYNGITYICSTKHVSKSTPLEGLEADQSKWTVVAVSDSWRINWIVNFDHTVGDVIRYGAITYRCITKHRTAATDALGLEADQSKWEIVVEGIEYKGDWTTAVRYKKYDIVKSGGSLWRASAGHTATTTLRADETNWAIWVPGLEFEAIWDTANEYNAGDIVVYGGYSYTALTNNTASVPSVNGIAQNTGDWELLVAGYRHLGDYSAGAEYKTGDVIREGGYLYIAIQDNTNIRPDTLAPKWQVLVTGRNFKAEWLTGQEYILGDVVTYAGTAYICIDRHLSDSQVVTDTAFWSILIQGTSSNVLRYRGDLRTFNSATERLPVGPSGAIVASTGTATDWATFEQVPNVYYVSTEGVDLPLLGKSINAPWRTVKYACDQVNAWGADTYTWNRGSDAASDTITAALTQLAASTSLTAAPTMETFLESTDSTTTRKYGDLSGNGGAIDAADATVMSTYITGGTVTAAQRLAVSRVIAYINANLAALKDESTTVAGKVLKFVTTSNNSTIFVKTGVYEELLPIKVPRNCAVIGDELRSTVIQAAAGEELKNMFYVNNGAGIRNMTLQGLSGTLGAANVNGTKTPTAGAFVSLDPGTGPTDATVWITNKSPYVQNVSTFGTGCIGMKIDGTLHSSGNKSIVANDFTQIISDGIGYWANEAGRSELVSVFTYFCHVGYYATNGGILRATNGNNSYGDFGCRAEGYSQFETPITAQIDNQTKEAEIHEVVTDSNKLLAIGYIHAGQSHTTATTTITGTGINASVTHDEFRQNAISQIRLIDPDDSSLPGGSNYQYLLNSAQTGTALGITLAASDTSGTKELYTGLRIVIVSGTGAGQYAYITDYDATSKIATLTRESDDSEGWDHLSPGYPIAASLDSTTRYSLEPAVNISEPTYSAATKVTGLAANSYKFITSDSAQNVLVVPVNLGQAHAYSTNGGATYTQNATALRASTSALGAVWTGSVFVVVGNSTYYYKTTLADMTTFAESSAAAANYTGVATDGAGKVILVLANGAVSYSSNHGATWAAATGIAGMPVAGNGKFIIVNDNGNVAYSTDHGATWTTTASALTASTWTSVVYGDGKFVAIGTDNKVVYSLDGITWYENEIVDADQFYTVSYGAGVFVASGNTNKLAKSQDGKVWTTYNLDSTVYTLDTLAFASELEYMPLTKNWIAVSAGATWNTVQLGATAMARVLIGNSRVSKFVMYNVGSNYTSTPTVTLTDSNATLNAQHATRLNDGVLTPLFTNRGEGYVTATASVTGDGFADIYQTGKAINLKNVSVVPSPGDNVVINGIDDVNYRLTKVTAQSGSSPNFNVSIEISPLVTNQNTPEHLETLIIREKYSQVRVTGHDFLDVGTGNKPTTDYPDLYLEGYAGNSPDPFNEVTEFDGARVFYTSTDQDGNFRVGELFAVEQSTGVVSINADFFELSGLEELSLGAIQIGGSAVVIREFSKEATFVANSNNIVPTQAAIISYLESKISGGSSDALTNTLVAGQIRTTGNTISSDSGLEIIIPVDVNMTKGIDGDYLAHQFYLSNK